MGTEHVNWFDKNIPIGTRKRHYINYNLHNGWDFWKTINYANKIFGKKPDYIEPNQKDFYPKECEHEFEIIWGTEEVLCILCKETCSSCGGSPGYGELCHQCGTFEG